MDFLRIRELVECKKELKKIYLYFEIFNFWLDLKQNGISIAEYMLDNNYRNVIIYGLKNMGNRLVADLKCSDITIVGVIDNGSIVTDLEKIDLEGEIPKADIVIVTAEFYFKEIKEKLADKVKCPVVSLVSILENASNLVI